jgi:VWFA-related protein
MKRSITIPFRRALTLALGFSFALSSQAQKPVQTPPVDDVVRTTTELVQTDVMVFDRRGNFVDSLRPEQFILTLNKERRAISLFSRVRAGSELEAKQLAAARNSSRLITQPDAEPTWNSARAGRLIFFFFDDFHLTPESLARGRKAFLKFVEHEMEPEDQVAVVSTSGQIGFLQQLTDNRVVLREAISRLEDKRIREGFLGKTRISEYVANRVQEAHDSKLFAYLMESIKIEFGLGGGALRGAHNNDSGGQAYQILKNRIDSVEAQGRAATADTLKVLRSLMESSARLPGRKLVFFLSDGFIVDPRTSNAVQNLREVIQAAARAGAVIYSIDTRGTFMDATVDASSGAYVDLTGRQGTRSLGETMAPREPLTAMAEETGGRAIFNSNSFEDAIGQAIQETSNYYVLAWRPDLENERTGKTRVEVSIEGRPDLKVRLRRNYYTPSDDSASAPPKKQASAPRRVPAEAELLDALASPYPDRTLPTSLSVGYVKNAESYTLQTSMQISRDALNLNFVIGNKAEVDVAGAAIDDRGLVYTFKQVLTVTPPEASQVSEPNVIWNQHLKVQPGLYQVRVAVRDRQSGRSGSAMQWIEVPRNDQNRLSMSSLFLGERGAAAEAAGSSGPQAIRVDVDHRFPRKSVLRFQTYVYNASRLLGAPDVWIRAQVLRGRQQVAILPANKIPPDVSKDPARLPYWTEISLEQLPAGRYTLQVSATDRAANTNASQSINFSVEQ